mmetsp:Transcript_45026/g.144906  ORF Transcript_45026/g.144906 Transcript_45026/m.144906 type:complete len:254 (+) Transcript_45026:478-1239(+)
MPVGTSRLVISSSEMPSRYLRMPRIELPCAATSTVLPRLRAGVMSLSQYGRHRSTVSLRHSESGISSVGMCAYLLSFPGQYSESVSIGGGGSEYDRRHCLTWSSPYLATVSFLLRPVSPPYMRSFSRQLRCTVTSSCPVILSTISSVCCARLRSDVYATSMVCPSLHSAVAPCAASFFPSVVRPTSAQPVKRFASFHTDWPCRSRISVACVSAFSASRGDAARDGRRTDSCAPGAGLCGSRSAAEITCDDSNI